MDVHVSEGARMQQMNNFTNWTSLDPSVMTTVDWSNATTAAPDAEGPPLYWGFITAAIAVVFFGSNFLPVKKFETGDGMFFQWVLCCAIWLTGLCVNAARHFPKFYPLAMLGGSLWATGNIMVVPIVKTIGLSLGLCIWACFNLFSGWATSRFGWLGFQDIPKNSVLNYIGVALCCSSSFIFMAIKSDAGPVRLDDQPGFTSSRINEEQDPLLPKPLIHGVNSSTRVQISDPDPTFVEKLSPTMKRIVGVSLAVISGLLYGVNFAPVIYIYESGHYKDPKPSQNGLDYVFSHFTGIFTASSFYFFIYCIIRKNQPRIYPKAILPAVASGVMWAIADGSWFVANAILSEPISFPIVTALPGVVVGIWGVFLLKEIKGLRNIILLLCAFTVSVTGAVLTGLSKA